MKKKDIKSGGRSRTTKKKDTKKKKNAKANSFFCQTHCFLSGFGSGSCKTKS